MTTEKLVNGAIASTLSSTINNSDATLSVASATGFPTTGNFRIKVGFELMLVTAVSGTTFTVTRGQEGTIATDHTSGVAVEFSLTKGTLSALAAEMYIVDTYANRPSAPRTGCIFFATDGYTLSRYTGSVWQEWGPIQRLYPPASNFDTGYTWQSQGSATFTRYGQAWILKIPAEATGIVRKVIKSAPATPYTVEFAMRLLVRDANFASGGMVLRNSSDSKFLHFGTMFHSPVSHIGTDKYNGDESYNSSYNGTVTNQPRHACMNYPLFFRMSDDGTTRKFQNSQDGTNWRDWVSTVRTDFTTGNQIGFGLQTSNNVDCYLEILHYREY